MPFSRRLRGRIGQRLRGLRSSRRSCKSSTHRAACRSHPLMRTLDAIHKAGVNVREIALAPLRLGDVSRLVAASLHCVQDFARPLAGLLHEKTGGNPFFAIPFLTALAEEKLLKAIERPDLRLPGFLKSCGNNERPEALGRLSFKRCASRSGWIGIFTASKNLGKGNGRKNPCLLSGNLSNA